MRKLKSPLALKLLHFNIIHYLSIQSQLSPHHGRTTRAVGIGILRNVKCEMDGSSLLRTRQERPAVDDKPTRRLQNDCTVYVRAVWLQSAYGIVGRVKCINF